MHVLPKQSRFVVHAAIQALVDKEELDEESALSVASFAGGLKKKRHVSAEWVLAPSDDDDITGYTGELGNVKIRDSSSEEDTEGWWGVYKERVGKYILWKEREGLINFHETGKEDNLYYLWYNPLTLDFVGLGIQTRQHLCSFWFVFWVRIYRMGVEIIHGRGEPVPLSLFFQIHG